MIYLLLFAMLAIGYFAGSLNQNRATTRALNGWEATIAAWKEDQERRGIVQFDGFNYGDNCEPRTLTKDRG